MTRKKVKLAYILNDAARKATLKKRKKGLMKKVSELSTLCGIDACAIVYSPYDSIPEVWPSHNGVQRVLSNFKRMPEMDQSKKMMNQESFLGQRVVKASEQLKKQMKDNREKEMIQVMFQCLLGKTLENFGLMDLTDLGWMIDQYQKEVDQRRSQASNQITVAAVGGGGGGPGPSSSSSSSVPATSTATATAAAPVYVPQVPEQPPPPPPAVDHGGMMADAAAAAAGMEMLNMNMDSMQKQQPWFMDLIMNPQEDGDQLHQMGFGGDDMVLPFGDTNQNPHWSHGYIP